MNMLMDLINRELMIKFGTMPWAHFSAFLVLIIIVGITLRKHGTAVVWSSLGMVCFAIGSRNIEKAMGFLFYCAGWSGFYDQSMTWQIVWLSIKLGANSVFAYMLIVGVRASSQVHALDPHFPRDA